MITFQLIPINSIQNPVFNENVRYCRLGKRAIRSRIQSFDTGRKRRTTSHLHLHQRNTTGHRRINITNKTSKQASHQPANILDPRYSTIREETLEQTTIPSICFETIIHTTTRQYKYYARSPLVWQANLAGRRRPPRPGIGIGGRPIYPAVLFGVAPRSFRLETGPGNDRRRNGRLQFQFQ